LGILCGKKLLKKQFDEKNGENAMDNAVLFQQIIDLSA
jgi:hypothetical protein